MSPSFAPTSMNEAMTSVYAVIASWTPWIVVPRSATICEIETFMTELSSTITNWAAARIRIAVRFFMLLPRDTCADGAAAVDPTRSDCRRGWRSASVASGAAEGADQRLLGRPPGGERVGIAALVVLGQEAG